MLSNKDERNVPEVKKKESESITYLSNEQLLETLQSLSLLNTLILNVREHTVELSEQEQFENLKNMTINSMNCQCNVNLRFAKNLENLTLQEFTSITLDLSSLKYINKIRFLGSVKIETIQLTDAQAKKINFDISDVNSDEDKNRVIAALRAQGASRILYKGKLLKENSFFFGENPKDIYQHVEDLRNKNNFNELISFIRNHAAILNSIDSKNPKQSDLYIKIVNFFIFYYDTLKEDFSSKKVNYFLSKMKPASLRKNLKEILHKRGGYSFMPEHGVNATLGVEIEYSNIPSSFKGLTEYVMSIIQQGWSHPGDLSVYPMGTDGYAGETTTPIVHHNTDLKFAMLNIAFLQAMKADTNETCGLHVHIGVKNLETPQEFEVVDKQIQERIDNHTIIYTDYQLEFVKQFLLIYKREEAKFSSIEREDKGGYCKKITIPKDYGLALMSESSKPSPQTIELTTEGQKEGYTYRIIDLEGEVKTGMIPWSALPSDAPKELKEEDILDNKNTLLPAILKFTSTKGQTFSRRLQGITLLSDLIRKINPLGRDYEFNLFAFIKHGTMEIRRFSGTTDESIIYTTMAMISAMAKEAQTRTRSIFSAKIKPETEEKIVVASSESSQNSNTEIASPSTLEEETKDDLPLSFVDQQVTERQPELLKLRIKPIHESKIILTSPELIAELKDKKNKVFVYISQMGDLKYLFYDTKETEKQGTIANGYDLALMSESSKPPPKTIELTTERQKEGYVYRIINLEGEVKTGIIPWSALPSNAPKELKEEDILDNKNTLLPAILKFTSNAGHTLHNDANFSSLIQKIAHDPFLNKQESDQILCEVSMQTGALISDRVKKLKQTISHLPIFFLSPRGDDKDFKPETQSQLMQERFRKKG